MHRNGKKQRTDAALDEVYELGKTIGSGAFSKVKLVTDLATGMQYACKVCACVCVGGGAQGEAGGEVGLWWLQAWRSVELACCLQYACTVGRARGRSGGGGGGGGRAWWWLVGAWWLVG